MLPERLRRRHYLGSWDDVQGLVYDEFVEARHVVKPFEIPDTWEKGFILDHGFTNPTAVLWYAIDYDGNIILYDEHYMKEKPVSFHAGEILKRGIAQGWCDPSIFAKTQSRGNYIYSIADEYKDFKVSLWPADRSDEAASIARVNEFFKADKIKVFSTLPNFIDEVSNWKYKTRANVRLAVNAPEEPEDLNNHLMDDLKYLIASRFKKSSKPEPLPVERSLDWYDKQKEYEIELKERRHGRKVW